MADSRYRVVAEGLHRPSWTVEQVARDIAAIRGTVKQWILPVPAGVADHPTCSFTMVSKAT